MEAECAGNTGPGACVPGAHPRTESCKAKEEGKVHALLHHVGIDLLREAFFAFKRDAAPGVDQLTLRRRP
jgi:RNA-directed DNA polymerase